MATLRVLGQSNGKVNVEAKAEEGEDLRDYFPTRFQCTKDTPWSGNKSDAPHGVQHIDAREVDCQDGYPGGDVVKYNCPHCKTVWTQEAPQ